MHLSACVIFTTVVCSSLAAPTGMSAAGATDFLAKFGYLKPSDPRTGSLRTEKEYESGIKAYQAFNGLTITGKLDTETLAMMAKPRCGLPDVETGTGSGRKKRYTLQGSKWPKTDLTYRIDAYSPDLSQTNTDSEIKRAFEVWENVTPLKITPVAYGQADISIKFAASSHGDGNPFDGAGGTLAHAYFPQFGGDAHFDEAETWTIKTYRGINLFQVAAHEFGHSLGLKHSSVSSALMAPVYRGYQPDFSLNTDDVAGIQKLYGGSVAPTAAPTQPPTQAPTPSTTQAPTQPPTQTPTQAPTQAPTQPPTQAPTQPPTQAPTQPPTQAPTQAPTQPPTQPPTRPSTQPPTQPPTQAPTQPPTGMGLCNDKKIDAVIEMDNGVMQVFKGSLVYEIQQGLHSTSRFVADGYPKSVGDVWENGPSSVDAAMSFWTWYGKYTYLFKGGKVWRYVDSRLSRGFPRSLSRYAGMPSNLDAAFIRSSDQRKYFVKGNRYYYYNRRHGRYQYHAKPSRFPAQLDAAMTRFDWRTYLFSNDKYYRVTYYRRSTYVNGPYDSSSWFGCSGNLVVDPEVETTPPPMNLTNVDVDANNNVIMTALEDESEAPATGSPVSSATGVTPGVAFTAWLSLVVLLKVTKIM